MIAFETAPASPPRDLQYFGHEPEIDPAVLQTLRTTFGFPALRPGQAEVVANALDGRDTLAIMPTGSGKSLTFQLPSLLLPGVTLVISPLIALMKDQVDSLPKALRDRTRLINSTLNFEEMRAALDELKSGVLRLVYVAPERLRDRSFLQAVGTAKVSLVVVDEAHCISLWGQDFRPDYLFIPRAVAAMGHPPVLAVTATATPAMAEEIATGLDRPMELVRLSLFRPNLRYEVHNAGTRELKIREMLAICRQEQGSGILYVNSRNDTERFAALLRDNGVSAVAYHAGLEPAVRAASQDRFMRGQVRVVVATIAFGMGVDKANVRFILHFNPPTSLEAYAQESGRAGRDGQPARCVLFATPNDETRLRKFARNDAISKEDLRTVYTNLKRFATGRWVMLDRADADALSGGQEELNSRVALGLLEQARLITRHPDAPVSLTLRWNRGEQGLWATDPLWQRFTGWLGPNASSGTTTIDVATACRELEVSPFDLDRMLAGIPGMRVFDGPRVVCIELLPAGSDAPTRVDRLLEELDRQIDRRIRQVISYAGQNQCRHVMLAAQFGEQLDPCGTACDVCTGTATAAASRRDKGPQGKTLDHNHACSVLQAVATLPFPMGRTGLVRLLTGSAESRVRADRSRFFGALEGMTAGEAGKLIDALVSRGYLLRDLNHEFNLIELTAKGKAADPESLAVEFASSSLTSRNRGGEEDQRDLDHTVRALYDRLAAWRLRQARASEVAAFVIASNRMLRAIAMAAPTTPAALELISGLGPRKRELYGEEILEIVNANSRPG